MSQNRTLLSKIVTPILQIECSIYRSFGPEVAKSRRAVLIIAPRFHSNRDVVIFCIQNRATPHKKSRHDSAISSTSRISAFHTPRLSKIATDSIKTSTQLFLRNLLFFLLFLLFLLLNLACELQNVMKMTLKIANN
jgi:hypothetical protein